jgi:hypothetical protein
MKKVVIILVAILIMGGVILFFRRPQSAKSLTINTQQKLSITYPENLLVDDGFITKISNDLVKITISRALFDVDPSKTGGDFCSGGGVTKEQLTLVGTVDDKQVFRKDDAYFAERAGTYCAIMPLFTKKYPDYDGIKVNFTFKSPDLSDLEKQKYTQIADQIVLSLKDTAKQ